MQVNIIKYKEYQNNKLPPLVPKWAIAELTVQYELLELKCYHCMHPEKKNEFVMLPATIFTPTNLKMKGKHWFFKQNYVFFPNREDSNEFQRIVLGQIQQLREKEAQKIQTE